MKKRFVAFLLAPMMVGLWAALAFPEGRLETLQGVARDIESLKIKFPQLKKFSARRCLTVDPLRINYAYHAPVDKLPHGWSTGAPQPRADGVWIYINVHEPGTAEVDTELERAPLCIGSDRVLVLIAEGEKTRSLEGAVREILRKHGATPCPQ